MLDDKAGLWLSFFLIAAMTFLPRSSFIVAGRRLALPRFLQGPLRHAPAAALAALIVPDILTVDTGFEPFNPKLYATLAVLFSVYITKNPWLPFIAGMSVLLGCKWI